MYINNLEIFNVLNMTICACLTNIVSSLSITKQALILKGCNQICFLPTVKDINMMLQG